MGLGRAKTLLGFFLLPAISMLVSFFATPVLVRVGGASGWAAVAIAQGLGATAAILITFGWGTVGPARVARSTPDEQKSIYWVSFVMRLGLFALAAPVAAGVAVLLAEDDFKVLAAISTLAYAGQALSPSWFLIGQSRPMAIAAMDTIPRSVALLLSMVMAIVTRDLLWFACIMLAAEAVISTVAVARLATRKREASTWSQVRAQMKEQWPLAGAALIGVGYTRAAVPIVAGVSYSSVATFGALDRMQLLARGTVRPFLSFFQGWIARPRPDELPGRRPMIASAVSVGMGVAVGGALFALLPVLDVVLFADVITISHLESGLLGLAVVFVAGSYATTLFYLVPQGRVRLLGLTSAIGSLSGVPAMLVLVPTYGAAGAIGAIAFAEGVVLVWQLSYLLVTSSRSGR